jgi:hypothetical protein
LDDTRKITEKTASSTRKLERDIHKTALQLESTEAEKGETVTIEMNLW